MEKDYKDLYEATYTQLSAASLKCKDLQEDNHTLDNRVEHREGKIRSLETKLRLAVKELEKYKEENVTAEEYSNTMQCNETLREELASIARITKEYYIDDYEE